MLIFSSSPAEHLFCTHLEHSFHVLRHQFISRHLQNGESNPVHDLPTLHSKFAFKRKIHSLDIVMIKIFLWRQGESVFSHRRYTGPLLVRCGKVPFTPNVSINASIMLAILLSLKTMESLQNGVATHFEVTPL